MDDRDFDMFLKGRDVPDVPSNLSHRIIEAARDVPQGKTRFDVIGWIKERVPDLMMPQPALALGLFLMLAVGLGIFGVEIIDVGQSQDVGDVSLAFYVDDLLGAEDYL